MRSIQKPSPGFKVRLHTTSAFFFDLCCHVLTSSVNTTTCYQTTHSWRLTKTHMQTLPVNVPLPVNLSQPLRFRTRTLWMNLCQKKSVARIWAPFTPNVACDCECFTTECKVLSQKRTTRTAKRIIFTLHRNGTVQGRGLAQQDTVGHYPYPCLEPVWIFPHGTIHYTFHLVPVLVPVTCSVGKPLFQELFNYMKF